MTSPTEKAPLRPWDDAMSFAVYAAPSVPECRRLPSLCASVHGRLTEHGGSGQFGWHRSGAGPQLSKRRAPLSCCPPPRPTHPAGQASAHSAFPNPAFPCVWTLPCIQGMCHGGYRYISGKERTEDGGGRIECFECPTQRHC